MILCTEPGVVVAVKGNCLTILLRTGNKLNLPVKHTELKLGDKCHISFDNSTGKPLKVYGPNEHTIQQDVPDSPKEPEVESSELTLLDTIELECSRETEGCEVWSEEFEVLELECSRETED